MPAAAALAGSKEGFTGGVTPSRFELNSDAGELIRRSIKIYNLSKRPQPFNIRTVDWQYSAEGQISYYDALQENSCRPWVRLERHKINVVPDPYKPRNFRFEVNVPEEAPDHECRFAIMIESIDSAYETKFNDGAIAMPVTGRIAVIVYIGVGDVKPSIEMRSVGKKEINGRQLPVVEILNAGDAHGRLAADLIAKDAKGKKTRLSIATSPIMPKQTRFLPLSPDGASELVYPVKVTGKIYSDQQSFDVDSIVAID